MTREKFNAISSSASSLGTTLWGQENSSRRAVLSPFYYDPNLKNWATRNKPTIQQIRGVMLAANLAGIVASHTWFFKRSLSITPKNQFTFPDGISMKQQALNALTAKKLNAIGGNSYKDYINYFNQFPDGKYSDLPNDLALRTAVDNTIAEGKTAFFNDRFNRFKQINDVTRDFTDEGMDVSDQTKYDAYFKAKYNVSSMDEAVTKHNELYPYNKIYAKVSDVTNEDASDVIKKAATDKTKSLLNTSEFNPFDALSYADKVGFGFLFFFQWAFTLLSAYGVFTANRALTKKSKSTATEEARVSAVAEQRVGSLEELRLHDGEENEGDERDGGFGVGSLSDPRDRRFQYELRTRDDNYFRHDESDQDSDLDYEDELQSRQGQIYRDEEREGRRGAGARAGDGDGDGYEDRMQEQSSYGYGAGAGVRMEPERSLTLLSGAESQSRRGPAPRDEDLRAQDSTHRQAEAELVLPPPPPPPLPPLLTHQVPAQSGQQFSAVAGDEWRVASAADAGESASASALRVPLGGRGEAVAGLWGRTLDPASRSRMQGQAGGWPVAGTEVAEGGVCDAEALGGGTLGGGGRMQGQAGGGDGERGHWDDGAAARDRGEAGRKEGAAATYEGRPRGAPGRGGGSRFAQSLTSPRVFPPQEGTHLGRGRV